MPIYDARSIPGKVVSGLKDPEIAAWLKTGPVLGAHKPIHEQRREHDAFIDAEPPPVGRVEFLGLKGPHGTVTPGGSSTIRSNPSRGGAPALRRRRPEFAPCA